MFGLAANLDDYMKQIIAALLTIAATPEKYKNDAAVWGIYKNFLEKQESIMITKKDYEEMIEYIKSIQRSK